MYIYMVCIDAYIYILDRDIIRIASLHNHTYATSSLVKQNSSIYLYTYIHTYIYIYIYVYIYICIYIYYNVGFLITGVCR